MVWFCTTHTLRHEDQTACDVLYLYYCVVLPVCKLSSIHIALTPNLPVNIMNHEKYVYLGFSKSMSFTDLHTGMNIGHVLIDISFILV